MMIFTQLTEGGDPVDTRHGEDGYRIKIVQRATSGIKAAVGRRVELVLDSDQVVELAKGMLSKLPAHSLGKGQAKELLQIVRALTIQRRSATYLPPPVLA